MGREIFQRLPSVEWDGHVVVRDERIPIGEAERILSVTADSLNDPKIRTAFLWRCAKVCELHRELGAAHRFLDEIHAAVEGRGDDEVASCLLAMGCIHEQARDYHSAAEIYRSAAPLKVTDTEVRYFLLNNLGYSLNMLHRHEEAAASCRAAIAVDAKRPNAHKNLGLALDALGNFEEAARSYMRATVLCPADRRAFFHLKELVARVPSPERIPTDVVCWLRSLPRNTERREGNA